MFNAIRFSSRLGLRTVRWNSTSSSVPPLMAKLRSDLKDAMRAKDTPRLNVLRALISETNNAAKTASPIETDLQLLSLIRKKISASKDAAEQFLNASRSDLKEKEDAQITVYEEYAGQIQTMTPDDIKAAVESTIAQLGTDAKLNVGTVLKNVFAPGGALDGKPAEKSEVAQIVKELLPKN
ncbi:Altered inheritance of mitochondria protein 41 [Talaromyces pinophilus]|nr:Altered inheritance of mitochondria protein 41 [Talaromyces pinophilus]